MYYFLGLSLALFALPPLGMLLGAWTLYGATRDLDLPRIRLAQLIFLCNAVLAGVLLFLHQNATTGPVYARFQLQMLDYAAVGAAGLSGLIALGSILSDATTKIIPNAFVRLLYGLSLLTVLGASGKVFRHIGTPEPQRAESSFRDVTPTRADAGGELHP